MDGNVRLAGLFQSILVGLIVVFLLAPIIVTLLVAMNASTFDLPPTRFTLEWYRQALASREFTTGALVSFVVAATATLLANGLALLCAFGLVRYDFPGKAIVSLLISMPLLVPSTILGLALYIFVIRAGIGAGFVQLVIGHVLLVFPFAAKVLIASVQTFNRSLEEAAANVGATPLQSLIHITIPLLKTGLTSGIVMGFIISWNDFTISLFLASPDWTPLPIQIYTYIKFQYDGVGAAVVSLVIFTSVFLIFLASRFVGLKTVFGKA